MGDPFSIKTCPECSHSNPADVNYCGRCGKYVGHGVQETLTKPPSPPPAVRDALSFAPGQKFGGRYVIIEEIGRGGMGRVYKARDQKLGLTVALKMIRPEYSADPAAIDRLKQETLLARSLAQENIIRVFDLGEHEGINFISMEFVPGQSLGQLLRASGALTEETAVSIARQVCRALAAARDKGIVHRDLKPSNILVDSNGRVHVADFGLAKSLETVDGSRTGGVVGTPAYLSPEQAQGRKTDQRTDIYALGVILYEMLTGRRPFESETTEGYIEKHIHEKPAPPSRWNPRLPPYLEKIILRCLEKDPEKRFQSASAVLEAMPGDETVRPLPAPKNRSRKLGWGLAAAAALALVVFGLYHFALRRPSGPPAPPEKRISVAVMYFENQTGDPNLDYLRTNLNTQVIQALLQSRYIRVITEDRLLAILNELKLQDRQKYSTEDLKRVAAKAQVKHILQGIISKIGQEFSMYSVLHDTGTWEPVANDQEKGTGIDSLNGMVDRLIRQIKADLKLSRQQINDDIAAPVNKITTDSQEALKEYITGKMLYYERKFLESTQAFQKAIALDPGFAMAYWGMALNFQDEGKSWQAKESLARAQTLAEAGRVSIRERYLIQGLYATLYGPSIQKALDDLSKLVVLYPDDEDGNIFLGSLYRAIEDWDLSQERFEATQRINKYNGTVYLNLVFIYKAKGLYDKARHFLDINRDSIPETDYYCYLSEIDLCQGRLGQALDGIEKALDKAPGNPLYMILKGNCHQLRGEVDTARKIYTSVQRDPDDKQQLEATLCLALLDLQEGRYAECRSLLSEGMERSHAAGYKSTEIDFLWYRARLELQTNNPVQALRDARNALAIAQALSDIDQQKQALFILGLACLRNKLETEALQVAQELKQLVEHSNNLKHMRFYHHLMGTYYREKGLIAQAGDSCGVAVSMLAAQHSQYDEHALCYDDLAATYEASGDLSRAEKTYENIIALTSGRLLWGDIYVRSFYHLGKIYDRKGLTEKSREAYRQFLSLWKNADPGLPDLEEARRELKKLL